MTDSMDLKALERKAYTTYHQDGIVDIFLGLAIVTFALLLLPMLADTFIPLLGGITVIWVVGFGGAKRAITVPRMGYVEFKKQRRMRIMILAVFLLVLNIGLFMLFATNFWNPGLSLLVNQYGLYIVAVAMAGLFTLFGWATQISRLYIYGGVSFVVFVLAQVLFLYVTFPIFALGLVITVAGFVLLYRFFQRYPKHKHEEAPSSQWLDEEARDEEVVVNE